MEKPVPAKRVFNLIVDANATAEQVASGKYVKTIAEAFNAAPSNSSTRFLVLITNGTYNLGGMVQILRELYFSFRQGKIMCL